jgi:ribosomal protein L11 methyltransferase
VIRLALRVRRDDAERVLAELLDLAPNGVEENEEGETVEFAVYGAPGEVPELPELRAAAGDALFEVRSEEIPDDWADAWRDWHRPRAVGGRLWVRPPWEEPREDLLDVVVDPGRAFGTGAHHTTRLCLELLAELEPGGAFLDLGCGSGVLAIAAARLGWEPVTAVDLEPAAVEAARANAALNGVSLDVRRMDLRREPPPSAPTVTANLLRPLLLELAESWADAPERLIVSGLLRGEAAEVAAEFARGGLVERERREAGEWAALLLTAA